MCIYYKIRDFAKNHSTTNGVLSSLLKFLYKVFTSEYINVFISFLGTIVIGIMLALQYLGFWFYFFIIIYVISLFMSAFANKYKNEKLLETKMLNQSLLGVSKMLSAWSICLQKCAKEIYNFKKNKNEIELIMRSADFQTASFIVCEKLHENLTKYCNNDDIYITVYQRDEKDDNNYCKMIAYSTENEPSSFNTIYDIPKYSEKLLGKIPYHSYLFSMNATDIAILPSHESIEKRFVWHDINKERESGLQQYIALPISIAKQGVLFILQIDTCKENLFGNNKKEIETFVKTALLPYSHFLHMIYEESKTIIGIERSIEK